MITVTIDRKSGAYSGFKVEGHADYGGEDEPDVVCAAVSALTINTVNSIEAFTDDAFKGEERDGFLSCSFSGVLSERAVLLMDSMVLGLKDIQKNYGKPYIRIIFREV